MSEPIKLLARSDEVFKAMAETGLFNLTSGHGVRRVVIDMRAGQPPVIHVETFADERMLEVIPSLAGVQVKRGSQYQ